MNGFLGDLKNSLENTLNTNQSPKSKRKQDPEQDVCQIIKNNEMLESQIFEFSKQIEILTGESRKISLPIFWQSGDFHRHIVGDL